MYTQNPPADDDLTTIRELPPQALNAGWLIGENRLLAAGGVLDQPPIYRHANHAAYIWQILTEVSSPNFKITDLSNDQSKMIVAQKILAIRQKILMEQH